LAQSAFKRTISARIAVGVAIVSILLFAALIGLYVAVLSAD
jgi:hypothetical protein